VTTKRKALVIALAVALVLVFPAISALTKTRMEDLHPKKEWVERERLQQAAGKTASAKETAEMPQPIGPEDAPVRIQVFVQSSNHCHTATTDFVSKLPEEEAYKGKVRVEFLDTSNPEAKKKASDAKIGCDAGLLVNGKTAMRIPGHGEAGLVIFTGPVNEKNYKEADLRAAIDQILKVKASGKAKGNV
jgi:hypothetical protein